MMDNTDPNNDNKTIELSGEIRSPPHVHIPITAPRHEPCTTSFLEARKEKCGQRPTRPTRQKSTSNHNHPRQSAGC